MRDPDCRPWLWRVFIASIGYLVLYVIAVNYFGD